MADLGAPSSYLALQSGADVFSRDGDRVGEVRHVLADFDADVFDGIVLDSSALPGGLRFADSAQVDAIYDRWVVLTLVTQEAERLPEPSDNPGSLEVHGVEDVDRTELREKLRRAWEVVSGGGHKS